MSEYAYVIAEINCELKAMREVGMNVPAGADAYVLANAADMQEYRENGMKFSEIADLVCSIA